MPIDPATLTAELANTAEEYDHTGEFPTAGIQAVHRAGLLTATAGAEYGGAALNIGGTARLLAALGEGDPSVALITAMTLFQHAAQATRGHWPTDLYKEVLAASAHRPTLLNAARVEPELGSPARGGLPATTARRTATGWALSGTKRFVTGAEGLAYFLVWAATDEPVPKVGAFAVPGGSAGIDIVRTWDTVGLRASGSHDVVFTDVEIPVYNVVGPLAEIDGRGSIEHIGLGLALASIYLGVGRAAQRAFHRFAWERVPSNLGRPVAETDRFRAAAGEIDALLGAAEHLLFGLADRVDRGEEVPDTRLLGARVVAVRHLTDAVQAALRLLGNPGLSRLNPLERHFRDIQFAGVHAPQADVALGIVGAAALSRERG
ncbi:acyl-CoA dehydrogenase family protein [Saccharopolyspora sp. 5N708]|uniref:acyl-CoA dehydrogenase family protein n=1 Tax=Saccharopolyspora sp. 5N708 TaxID=3457424 RepID=UPI003FD3F353